MGSFSEKLIVEARSKKAVSFNSESRKNGSININLPGESGIAGVVKELFIPFDVDVNAVLEFLTEMLNSRLECNTLCNCRSAISAYHEAIDPFVVGKHPLLSDSMTGLLIIGCLNLDTILYGKGDNSFDTLDLNEAKLKLLTYKLTMLLALTESSKANEICYLEICYIFITVLRTVSTSPRSRKQQKKS